MPRFVVQSLSNPGNLKNPLEVKVVLVLLWLEAKAGRSGVVLFALFCVWSWRLIPEPYGFSPCVVGPPHDTPFGLQPPLGFDLPGQVVEV